MEVKIEEVIDINKEQNKNMITSDSFNDVYVKIIKDVFDNGTRSFPRGKEIIELIGYQFKLTNPLNSLCTIKERNLNYAFGIIEKFEYLYGESDPERLCFYNSNMKNFLNDNNEFDGSYAPRIKNQLEYVYNLLKNDPDSRQAVITLRDSRDTHESKDIPCTLSLQFLLRNNKLNLVATMRSNDLLWGTPYDVNGFTFLQQALASWLNVEIGEYIHQAGSLHIYVDTLDKYNFMNSYENNFIHYPKINLTKEDTLDQLEKFFMKERALRERNTELDFIELHSTFDSYYKTIKDYINKKYDTNKKTK